MVLVLVIIVLAVLFLWALAKSGHDIAVADWERQQAEYQAEQQRLAEEEARNKRHWWSL